MHKWAGITYEDLTPEQNRFLSSILAQPGQDVLVTGCAGSGKTVIGAHAAQLLRNEKQINVTMLAFTKLLAKFIKDGFADFGNEAKFVQHYHGWSPTTSCDLAIIDEGQDFKSDWIARVKRFSRHQIWIGDPTQQIYSDAAQDNGFLSLARSFGPANRIHLDINRRNSISIAEFARRFITLTDMDKAAGISLDDKITNFIEPIARNPLQTSGARNQPNTLISCRDSQEEFDVLAALIKDLQSPEKHPGEERSHIAIAQLLHDTLDVIERELKARAVPFYRIPHYDKRPISELPNFNASKLTILTPIHSLKGLEVDYVLFPMSDKIGFWESDTINNNLLHVLFSRAMTRIYCSYTDAAHSYVYAKVHDSATNDFFRFITGADVLGTGVPTLPDDIVQHSIQRHFDAFKEVDL